MKTTLTILATFLLGGTLTANVYAQSTISEANFAELNQSVIQPFWQNQVQKGSLQSSDGLTLAYSYVIPAQAKATILLIQGRTESMMKYHELMWELSQQGYAVFTMDHRGQGLSDRMLENREKGHVEKFQQYVDDQQVFINTVVLSKQTSGQLLLLTHSMGGAVGSLLLAQQPTLFKAAVLSSPMHMPNTEVLFQKLMAVMWHLHLVGCAQIALLVLLMCRITKPHLPKTYSLNLKFDTKHSAINIALCLNYS